MLNQQSAHGAVLFGLISKAAAWKDTLKRKRRYVPTMAASLVAKICWGRDAAEAGIKPGLPR